MDHERMSEIHINDFPNEILEMVFNRLPFDDLLRASLVCVRWSTVISSFCSHRILLLISTNWRMEFLDGFRSFKHIAIDFSDRAVCGVTFENSLSWMNWLQEIAPHLETLLIHIPHHLFYRLVKLNLENLLEFHLKTFYARVEYTRELEQIFCRFKRLKVLKMHAHSTLITSLTRCIYTLKTIERLELSQTDFQRVEIAGIWNMTRLIELAVTNAGIIQYPPEDTIQPLPSLKKLLLQELKPQDVSKLHIMFHNVTSLDICLPISGDCLHMIVNSWPTLECLSIRIKKLLGVAKNLRRLPELRRLKLELAGQKQFSLRSSFRLLNSLLRIRSLERLYIDGHGDISVPDRNPRCKLFLNDRFMPR